MLDALTHKLELVGLEIIDIDLQYLVVSHPKENRERTLSLHNLYKKLNGSERAQHEAILDHFVQQIMAEIHHTSKEGRYFPLLTPDVEDKRLHAPWSIVLLPKQLRLVIALEQGDRLKLLSPLDVVRSGTSIVDLKKEAMDNLFMQSKHVQPQRDALGTYRFEIGDGYDASRFLMVRHWFPSTALWIAMPSRDSLWVCTTAPSQEVIQALKEAYKTLPYPLISSWIKLPARSGDASSH